MARKSEEETERLRAERLADAIEELLKGEGHNAVMDGLAMVLRSLAEGYPGRPGGKLADLADEISDLMY